MQNNVIDLIIFLAKRIHLGTRLKDINIDKMQGYNKSEISAAYSWLAQKYETGENDRKNSESNTLSLSQPLHPRILHQSERAQISSDAYGYLLELYYLRIIDEVKLERLIEYSMFRLDGRTDLSDVKEWVARMIFNSEHSVSDRSVLLKGNETIN